MTRLSAIPMSKPGYWDGKQLWFRSGHAIHPPPWFTQGFPKTALDGELWRGRGQFESLSRTVRKSEPTDEEWHTVRYMLFELPDAQGTFTQRIEMLKALVARTQVPWLQVIEQFRISDRKSLKDKLSRIIAAGGEGLMLHRAEASYHSGRSNDLLKFKPYLDREASVIAHIPGKGRNAGRLGSLLVEDDEGRRFRLGTGFTDEQRNHPPAIGSVITYKVMPQPSHL